MSTINFELSKKLDKATNRKQILVRVSISRTFRVGGKTKIFIDPKDWDEKTMSIRKPSRIEKKEKQVELDELRKKMNRLVEHISREIGDNHDWEKLSGKEERQHWIEYVIDVFYDPCLVLTRKEKLRFDDFLEIYIQTRSEEEQWVCSNMQLPNKKKVWDNPIYDKLCAVRTQMNAFVPNLIMDDITGETMDEYQNFLIKRGFKNSTIEKHICYLRQILDWSNKRGYLKHGESIIKHKTPKLELSKPKATNYLTWEEFEEMYNYEFGPGQEHLEITRDRFCFCCATSLRHSDLEILKKSHFHNENGNEFFSLISKKTHDDLIIPLNDYSRALYYKYKDVDSKNGLLFPSKSNQKMNDNLKTIA